MPSQVEIVSVSGDALSWFKLAVVVQLALGVAVLTVLVAAAVVVLWRGR